MAKAVSAGWAAILIGVEPEPREIAPQRADEPEPAAIVGIVATVVGILLLAALIVTIEPLRSGIGDAVSGDTGEPARRPARPGGRRGLITLALALAHVVVWYPAEILDAAVGYVYGFWVGLPLVMFGWILNGLVAYWVGRHAARPLLYRFIGRRALHPPRAHGGGRRGDPASRDAPRAGGSVQLLLDRCGGGTRRPAPPSCGRRRSAICR